MSGAHKGFVIRGFLQIFLTLTGVAVKLGEVAAQLFARLGEPVDYALASQLWGRRILKRSWSRTK